MWREEELANTIFDWIFIVGPSPGLGNPSRKLFVVVKDSKQFIDGIA